jgi:hypothetical protein
MTQPWPQACRARARMSRGIFIEWARSLSGAI